MQDKKKTILEYGKDDGNDEERWSTACYLSQELDTHVNICFEKVVSLEERGLIKLNKFIIEDE
jgi:hypothetical protein